MFPSLRAIPFPVDAFGPLAALFPPFPAARRVSPPRDCPETSVGALRRPPWSVAIATCPTAEGLAPVPDAPRGPPAVDWLPWKLAMSRKRPRIQMCKDRCRVLQMAVQRVRTAFEPGSLYRNVEHLDTVPILTSEYACTHQDRYPLSTSEQGKHPLVRLH